MLSKKNRRNGLATLALLLSCQIAIAVQDEQTFGPPNATLTDSMFVNVLTGQLSPSLSTVAIGGELGLSHKISMYANHMRDDYGYTDKFSGRAHATIVGTQLNLPSKFGFKHCDEFRVMRVFGFVGTADFVVKQGNDYVCNLFASVTGNYVYEPLGDAKHALEVVQVDGAQELLWTLPDGTEVSFEKYASDAEAGGKIKKVVYPNGFTITIDSNSVVTNTGYQLKYIFENDPAKFISDPEKRNALPYYTTAPAENMGWWAARNPVEIKAINNAFEYCDSNLTDNDRYCAGLAQDWPTVQFVWPNGMPRAMYVGQAVFKVVGPEGGVTEYHYQAQDLAVISEFDLILAEWALAGGYSESRELVFGMQEHEAISPRLVGIKPAGADEVTYSYIYKTDHEFWVSVEQAGVPNVYSRWDLGSHSGILVRANSKVLGPANYVMNAPTGQGGNYTNTSSVAGRSINVKVSSDFPGTPLRADVSNEGSYIFNEPDFTGRLSWKNDLGDSERTYFNDVDSRGNLKSIQRKEKTLGSAGYPTSCSNPKTCNKPLWIADAKGLLTDYTYHAESGQVLTVTQPADNNGIRPQTRYWYEQKQARFKQSSSGAAELGSPIWVLVGESYCRAGAAAQNHTNSSPVGCVNASDEVKKTYAYFPENQANNLQVRSITVTADQESRTTCYQYDIYGNRIGETAPKGASNSCL